MPNVEPLPTARRGDLVRVHMLDGDYAYDGICFSSTKRGTYVVNASSGAQFPARSSVRIEVLQPSAKRKVRSSELLSAAKSVSWTSDRSA